MHTEVYWRRLVGKWERRGQTQAALPRAGSREKGPLPASPLWLLGCMQGEPLPRRAMGQMPITASLRGRPPSLVPQLSGCRQPCASASAGPGTLCGREGHCSGTLLRSGAPAAQARMQWCHIHPESEPATRTNPSTMLLQALGAIWHGQALAQRGGGCRPQFRGLRWTLRYGSGPEKI